MQASHWVVEDILKAIETGKKDEITDAFKHFLEKYPNDKEIVQYAKQYLKGKDSKLLKDISIRLKAIMDERKMEEGSGGSQLWFGDRRGHGDQTLR